MTKVTGAVGPSWGALTGRGLGRGRGLAWGRGLSGGRGLIRGGA